MLRFKSLTNSPRAILSLALLLTATFVAAMRRGNSEFHIIFVVHSFIIRARRRTFEGQVTSKMFIGDKTMETRYAIKGTAIVLKRISPEHAGARLMQQALH